MEAYYVAGIDVHKRMLAVVITEVKPGECEFGSQRCAKSNWQLRRLLPQAAWAAAHTENSVFSGCITG